MIKTLMEMGVKREKSGNNNKGQMKETEKEFENMNIDDAFDEQN